VLDFGISKQLAPNDGRKLTNPSSSMGSPCYMSPEQMRNARLVDRRTDIWSMGAVLFELLAAQPPFDGDSLPEICAHVMCDAPRPLRDLRPGLPRGLEAVISRCLQKDRDKRFADVAEFARALSKYASPEGRASIPSIDHITSNSEAPVSAERRRPVVDSVAGFAPTVLAPLSAAWSEEPARDDETEARSVKIPGVRSRWGWVIGCALLLVATGVGMARYLGRDIFRPMRGVILPASLREDAIEVLPARPALELPSRFDRGPARAVREPEALTLSVTDGVVSPSPAPTLPAFEPGHANTAAEPVAQPSNDDPYAAPPPSL